MVNRYDHRKPWSMLFCEKGTRTSTHNLYECKQINETACYIVMFNIIILSATEHVLEKSNLGIRFMYFNMNNIILKPIVREVKVNFSFVAKKYFSFS